MIKDAVRRNFWVSLQVLAGKEHVWGFRAQDKHGIMSTSHPKRWRRYSGFGQTGCFAQGGPVRRSTSRRQRLLINLAFKSDALPRRAAEGVKGGHFPKVRAASSRQRIATCVA
ncbi:hypothetical protein [Sphingobacterium griseoflavum]|uniref:hypothetical protein n=1 Tax=Sphingobacterium griseoflavum TaxID=1474952 RepID=UPI00167A6016|nr:hypothetical protein [Sphingobacterium griseoflavum]